MPDIITFADAIADSERFKKRHLILGNGFSIGCRANIFNYASLFAPRVRALDFPGIYVRSSLQSGHKYPARFERATSAFGGSKKPPAIFNLLQIEIRRVNSRWLRALASPHVKQGHPTARQSHLWRRRRCLFMLP